MLREMPGKIAGHALALESRSRTIEEHFAALPCIELLKLPPGACQSLTHRGLTEIEHSGDFACREPTDD